MRYCKQCGSENPDADYIKFCSQCGATLEPIAGPGPTVSGPLPAPEQFMQRAPAGNNYKQVQHTPSKKTISKKQTGGIIAIASLGLAVILLFNFVIAPAIVSRRNQGRIEEINKTPEEDNSKLPTEQSSIKVTADQSRVEISGITIDVNPLNLSGASEKLTVIKHSQIVGEDGFLGQEYDISLGERHYLLAPLEISVPFDPDALAESRP